MCHRTCRSPLPSVSAKTRSGARARIVARAHRGQRLGEDAFTVFFGPPHHEELVRRAWKKPRPGGDRSGTALQRRRTAADAARPFDRRHDIRREGSGRAMVVGAPVVGDGPGNRLRAAINLSTRRNQAAAAHPGTPFHATPRIAGASHDVSAIRRTTVPSQGPRGCAGRTRGGAGHVVSGAAAAIIRSDVRLRPAGPSGPGSLRTRPAGCR
jgi:hypothetical protein